MFCYSTTTIQSNSGGACVVTMTTTEEHVPLMGPPHLNHMVRDTRKKSKVFYGLSVCYSLLLCWQLTGTYLFLIRCVTCFKKNSLTYRCENNAAFDYSGELELTWLVTQCLQGVILIAALHKVPAFPGYKAILQHLKYLPSFWTLVLLFLAALSRFVILSVSSNSFIQLMIVAGFELSYILRVLAVGFLNYTQFNLLKGKYPIFVFVLSKMTLLVIFIECFNNFILSFLSLTLKIEDIHRAVKIEKLSDIEIIYDILRVFSTTTFRLKIMSFFWNKLFNDNR